MLNDYPACRYAVVNGELKSVVVNGPEEEREGWISSPHPFRALAVDELIQLGEAPEEALKIHQRELRRVALVFAGRSLDEAEKLSEFEPQLVAGVEGDVLAEIERLKAALVGKEAEIGAMVAKFDKAYDLVVANVKRLTVENAELAKRHTRPTRAVKE